TSYSQATNAANSHQYWRASGAGSRLSFPSLTMIEGGNAYNTQLFIESLTGGQIDLPNVATIKEINAGDQRYRAFHLLIEGIDSVIDLGKLTEFSDLNSGSSTGVNLSSTIHVRYGGQLNLGDRTGFKGIDVTVGKFG